ncbi:MAG: hypothetical protein LBJ44_01810 [Propionibacteriaceae bacterium]|jgi:hypothetical protein|nr:hypothetical protein [Propionibacteriaceae bacterium]
MSGGGVVAPGGDRASRGMMAAVAGHPELGRLCHVDRGRLGRWTVLTMVAAVVVGLPLGLWASDSWSQPVVVAVAGALVVLIMLLVWGLNKTQLLVCQGGLLLSHPWFASRNHNVLLWSVLDPGGFRPVTGLERLAPMADRRFWAFNDGHPNGPGIVFVGPIPQPKPVVTPSSAEPRLWWYACRRDPAEVVQAVVAALVAAGRLAPGPTWPTVELSGRPQDAVRQLPPLPSV